MVLICIVRLIFFDNERKRIICDVHLFIINEIFSSEMGSITFKIFF